jgi:hypothetical protein
MTSGETVPRLPPPPTDGATRPDMLADRDAWTEPVAHRGSPGLTEAQLPPVGPGERWCSVEQAATLFGLSTPTVRRRIKAGGPPFHLPDGSAWPVVSERISRPQGTAFVLKMPAEIGASPPDDPPQPDTRPTSVGRVSGVTDASVAGAEDESPVADDTSSPPTDASDVALALVAQVADARELVGELRARHEAVLADLEASRRAADASLAELADAVEAREVALAAWGLERAELEVTRRHEQDRRLAAEAALLALTAREDALEARERDVRIREARLVASGWLGWWRRLFGRG